MRVWKGLLQEPSDEHQQTKLPQLLHCCTKPLWTTAVQKGRQLPWKHMHPSGPVHVLHEA